MYTHTHKIQMYKKECTKENTEIKQKLKYICIFNINNSYTISPVNRLKLK